MIKKRIYLDTSIFIAEFDKKSEQHKKLTKYINELPDIKDVQFCYSKWALTEMYNRLTKKQIEELRIVKYINNILDRNKLRKVSLNLLNVSPNQEYNFNDFFNHLTKDLIKYKTGKSRPGLGDIIHIRIMKNNRISTVITFDSHFDKIQNFMVINLLKQGTL